MTPCTIWVWGGKQVRCALECKVFFGEKPYFGSALLQKKLHVVNSLLMNAKPLFWAVTSWMHHEWKKLERKAICCQPSWWRTLLLVQTVLQYPWCGMYLLKSTWIRSCLICKISTNLCAKYQQMYPLNKANFPHAPGLVIWQLCLCLWQSTSPFRPPYDACCSAS